MLLVLGGLAWYGYGIYFGDEAEGRVDGGGSGGVEALTEESLAFDLDSSARPADADDAAAGSTPAATEGAGDELGRYVEQLRSGDAEARAKAFAVHARLSGDARTRVAEAIEGAFATASPAEMLALLGRSNHFVHSDFGRRCLGVAVAAIHEQAPAVALPQSTKLLESALRGPIRKEHDAARAAVDGAYALHRNLVRRVVFDPANSARSRRHEVQPGESLDSIARKFRKSGIKVEGATLATVNRIDNPNALRAGQVLRIPIDPIRCVARKDSFSLCTYVGDEIVRMYWMAHGKEGHETPETTFYVLDKIPNPDWHHGGRVIPFGDPENPLGRFFVKFRHESYSGFGAHGTNEPDSIGTEASLGCLRLLPDDIAEFTRFVPRGAAVEIL